MADAFLWSLNVMDVPAVSLWANDEYDWNRRIRAIFVFGNCQLEGEAHPLGCHA